MKNAELFFEQNYEEYLESLVEFEDYLSKRDEVANRYTKDRIKEYYENNPLCGANLGNLVSATADVKSVNNIATVVLAVSAIEVLVKEVILRPVISCLMSDSYVSKFMCDSIIKQSGLDRFNRFLYWIFDSLFSTRTNVSEYKREDAKLTIWQERAYIQKIRNNIIHKGESCSHSDALLAMDLLNEFELLYRDILEVLGFSIKLDEQNQYKIEKL